MIEKIELLGHASIVLNLSKKIYIDPWQIRDSVEKADIILITHPHYDHYSEEDIQKLAKDSTKLISCKEVVQKTKIKNKQVITPFEEIIVEDIIIRGYPAYNINKQFHPKSNNWLGFIIIHNNVSYYIAGDTDLIEEAKNLKVNVMLLPVSGTYTMNEKEASELVNLTKPDYAIPIHYGKIVGTKKNAEDFLKLIQPPTKAIIL